MKIKIKSKLRQQLAHIFYQYGGSQEELQYKLESLVLEWFNKGVSIGIAEEKKRKSIIA